MAVSLLHLTAEKPLQHSDHIVMILHTGAFADAVHRPHWAADIDAADAEFCRCDRADGATAGQVAAVRIALVGNIGFLAPLDKARGAASSRSDDVAMLMRYKT